MVYKSKYCCYQYLKNCADLTEVFIGDTNVITEIIFSDYYRTFLLCILSIGVVFFMRNASIRKKVLALAGYEFIVFLLFLFLNIELNHEYNQKHCYQKNEYLLFHFLIFHLDK